MDKDRIIALKDKFISLVETQLDGNLECVDTKELGEVMDMAKDCAELMSHCAKAEYYSKVVESMETGTTTDTTYRNRMYYSPVHTDNDGVSYISRREYIDASTSGTKSNELEVYVDDLTTDIMGLVGYMDSAEKQMFKQKVAQIIAKIV